MSLGSSRLGTALLAFLLVATTLAFAPPPPARAATSELFISEYVEGSGISKAIEIYNGTGAPVDLSAYTLELYSNGSTAATGPVILEGTVADGDVFVIANSGSASNPAPAEILAAADQISNSVVNFNGDDVVVLRRGAAVVDAFGQIGFRPTGEWPGGGADDTLVRNADVCAGDTDPTDVFSVQSTEWVVHPNNTFTELGSHTANCGGVSNAPVVVVCDIDLVTDEGVEASASLSASDADGTVVDISASVDPIPAAGSIAIASLAPAASEGGTATADLLVDAEVPAGTYQVTITASNDDADPQTGECTQTVTVEGDLPITFIHDIQGTAETSPLVGQTVVIEGVVVGDYEGPSPTLRGFYVQEEDAFPDSDGDPATSEGIFVFNFSNDSVNLGDVVRVQAEVEERFGQTQLGFPDSLTVVSTGANVTAAEVQLPLSSADELERYEGMLVEFPQTLYVTEFFQLGRFGQIVVSSGDRLDQPTAVAEPGGDANAVQLANDLNRLIIDDADNGQNADPIVFGRGGNELTASNTLRGGDTVTGAVGVMTYTFGGSTSSSPNAYRLRPVGDLSDSGLVPGGVVPVFQAANARPAAAPVVGGSGKVASFNVLNYFVTLDTGGNQCGPVGFLQDCRGANSAFELDRQRDKLVSALLQIDADILGLIELENTEGVEPLQDIVDALNAIEGPGTYDYIETGTIGTDVIKVGIIYQPDKATAVGDHAILDSSVDPGFDDDRNRPALAQTFESDDEVFTVVVNHFKSKGCDASSPVADMDQGDGQGCFNATRTAAANAEVTWLASDPTESGDDDFLILGDLNSYAKEDPIDVLADAGYVDLADAFTAGEPYSYVFDGQWGYLDYALASPTMAAKVTGTDEYHINADEPNVLDYNTDFKSANHVTILFAPDEFRTSDHDPVVVGYCEAVAPAASAQASPDSIWPPNGKLRSVSVALDVTDANAFSVELVSVTSNEPIVGDVLIVDDTHLRLRAERDDEGPGRTYTITYLATDDCGNTTEFTATVVVPHDQGKMENKAV